MMFSTVFRCCFVLKDSIWFMSVLLQKGHAFVAIGPTADLFPGLYLRDAGGKGGRYHPRSHPVEIGERERERGG